MADPALFNAWLNPTFEVTSIPVPGYPPIVESIRSTINSLVDFLLGLLDLALTALDIVKTFAVGFLDPFNALIDAVISEVEAILKDLQNVGLYLTGDWYLIRPPYSDLQGGFEAFKSRMAARFTDVDDPTRPIVSEHAPVFAMFVYASVDFSQINLITRMLTQVGELFNFDLRLSSTLQTVTDLQVQYSTVDGFSGIFKNIAETAVDLGLGTFTTVTGGTFSANAQVPDVAQVSWSMAEVTGANASLSLPIPPPSGFLIEVSTVAGGLPVFYDRTLPSSSLVVGPNGMVQARESGEFLDPEGNPLVLFGGYDTVSLEGGLGYNSAMVDVGTVREGAARVWAQRSASEPVPIPLEALKSGDRYLLQRTFYISTLKIFNVTAAVSLLNPEFFQKARYRINLPREDMPYEAEFEIQDDGTVIPVEASIQRPSSYHVRITPVSSIISEPNDFQYVLKAVSIDAPGTPPRAEYSFVDPGDRTLVQIGRGDKGESSEPLAISFPADSSQNFIQQLTIALAVLVLSRSDLAVSADPNVFAEGMAASPTGLEVFSTLIPDILLTPSPDEFFDQADEDQESSDLYKFRSSVLAGCQRVAAKLYKKLGARPGQEESIVTAASILQTFKWSDIEEVEVGSTPYEATILESLLDFESVPGLSRNPECAGLKLRRGIMARTVGREVYVGSRTPGFFEQEDSGFTVGSVDRSPTLSLSFQDGSTRLFYLRNVIPPEVYAAASTVLGLAAAPTLRPSKDGAWIAFRLGQLFPEVSGFVDRIELWARSMQGGISSIVESVLEYIDFLEGRVLELQGLLNRLDALVENIITVEFPPSAALFLLANGTDGVLEQFLNAGNPPVDGSEAYGGGFVALGIGPNQLGIPDFVLDFIVDMFSGDGV